MGWFRTAATRTWVRSSRTSKAGRGVAAQVRTTMPVVLCCAVLVLLAIGVFRTRGLIDDGMIHLRVVQQFRSGHGLNYNLGERVEVSSSPLWVLFLAIGDFLIPMRLDSLAIALSGCFALAGVALVMWAAVLDASVVGGRAWPAAIALFGIHPAVWRWSTAGMEIGLAIGWIGLCWFLARRSRRIGALDAVYALVIGIGPLLRQDYVLACAAMLAASLWSERRTHSRRAIVSFAVIAAAPSVLYQLFRMAYFGIIVPNPTLAKNLGPPRWSRGWAWLIGNVITEIPNGAHWLVLAVVALGLATTVRSDRATAVGFVIAALTMPLGAIAAGGDFMNVRLLVPAVFALILPVSMLVIPPKTSDATVAVSRPDRPAGWVPLRRPIPARAVVAAGIGAVCCGLAVWSTTSTRFWRPDGERFLTATIRSVSDIEALIDLDRGRTVDDIPAVYFQQIRQESISMPQQTYVSIGIGAVALYRPVQDRVYDQLGLANPIGSHMMPIPTPWSLQGHEKPLPAAWVIADLGLPRTAEVVEQIPVELPRALSGVAETQANEVEIDTQAATRAMSCGALADVRAAARDPLTLSRAWKNLTGAWSRTWVTFDPDPQIAEQEHCGKEPGVS